MKTQRRKVGIAGGFINQLMGNNSTVPKVGEGATILMYSDRHAYEVVSVAEDENSCSIREMDCKFIGSGYGDERYEYSRNEENRVLNLEWNSKYSCWGEVTYSIDIIKSLQNKLIKEYGFDWSKHLPNGLKYDDLIDSKEIEFFPRLKLVKGITKEYKNFNKVSIIFGVMEQYIDPTF